MNEFLYPTFPFTFRDGLIDWNLNPDELRAHIEKEKKQIRKDKVWLLARELFKEDERPFEMSPGELQIFKLIFKRQHSRTQIVTSTQYGKTLTVAKATLLRISTFPDEYLVTEPDMKRGKILINYIIKATADNDYFKKKLIGVKTEDRTALNRLLEERNRVKLTYQIIGENDDIKYGSVEILTTEARRKNDAINAIMGFGGRNVISDESSLVDDEIEAGVFRMLAGKGNDTFYLKIGNPFYRNHFFQSWKSPRYKKVFIDYRVGLADGRYTPEFIEEAKEKPKFKVLFAARFPDSTEQDKDGYTPLLTEDEIEGAYVEAGIVEPIGVPVMGSDVSGGGRNFSVIVIRWDNVAKLIFRRHTPDPTLFGVDIAALALKYGVKPENVNIDSVGLGQAALGKARELLGRNVRGVNVGENPIEEQDRKGEEKQYLNIRAQAYWKAAQWIIKGGKIVRDSNFGELLVIKYKTARGDKKIQIIPKEELRDKGIESPDVADSLMLTFVPKARVPTARAGTGRPDKV